MAQKAETLPHVVIVGGGFAGIEACKVFKHQPVQVTLIDKRNFHLFQPLLYQVATGTLAAGDIVSPLRASLESMSNLEIRMAEVTDLDPQSRQLTLSQGAAIFYDYLIVAAGSQTSYFNNTELAKLPGLKTLEDAESIRQRILLAFEQADQTQDAEERAALLTFVVVGGGPTGVELSGAISELVHQALSHYYPGIDRRAVKIILAEGIHRILQPYPEKLSDDASKRLAELGVTLLTHAQLLKVEGHRVVLKHNDQEETLQSATVLWTAGVEGVPLGQTIAQRTGCPISKRKTLTVQPDFSLPQFPEIYVVGDLCDYQQPNQSPLPGVAPAAMQSGRYVARTILRRINRQTDLPAFHYQDKGSLAVIGRGSAVAKIGSWEFSGLLAWLIWAGVHIVTLIGFGNRIRVSVNWAASYLLNCYSSLMIKQELHSRTAVSPDQDGHGPDTAAPNQSEGARSEVSPLHA